MKNLIEIVENKFLIKKNIINDNKYFIIKPFGIDLYNCQQKFKNNMIHNHINGDIWVFGMQMLNKIEKNYMNFSYTKLYKFPNNMLLDNFIKKFVNGEIDIEQDLKELK